MRVEVEKLVQGKRNRLLAWFSSIIIEILKTASRRKICRVDL
jgi:hypothetical protein